MSKPRCHLRKARFFWCNLHMKTRYFAYHNGSWGCVVIRFILFLNKIEHSGKFVITICTLYILYLCAQVHTAWFDREYIYIYIYDLVKL